MRNGKFTRMNNPLFARIEARLSELGVTAAAASRKAGLSVDAIRNIGRTGGATARTLEALAMALETSVESLIKGEPAAEPARAAAQRDATPRVDQGDIPVLGTAAGSLGQGAFEITDPIDHIARPPALAGARRLYGIYVTGDSMAPEHKHGDVRIVHPGRPPRQGDTIIIQIRIKPSDPIQSYIKHFDRMRGDFVVCSQINPVAKIEFARNTVLHIHKILTQNELLGA